MNNYWIETSVNSRSFLEQKYNTKSFNAREIFVLPAFTVSGFPIKSALNTDAYQCFLEVQYLFSATNHKDSFSGKIHNLVFQYDLNYSKTEGARGQIKLSSLLSFSFVKGGYTSEINNHDTTVLGNDKKPITDFTTALFSFYLPTSAVRNKTVNTLNYNFTSDNHNATTSDFAILNGNNFGSVTFFFNPSPKYELHLTAPWNSKTMHNYKIANPIMFYVAPFFFIDDPHIFKKPPKWITGIEFMQEVFEFSFPSLYSLSTKKPMINPTIKHYFEPTFKISNINHNWQEKFDIFRFNFNLQQKLETKIDDNLNFFSNKKLQTDVIKKWAKDEYDIQIHNFFFDPLSKKINNSLNLPYYEPFNFSLSIPLEFETFFSYKININIINYSERPIIGPTDADFIFAVFTPINEEWTAKTKITMTREEIIHFYKTKSFTWASYQNLQRI